MKSKMDRHSKLIEQNIQTVRDLSYGLSPPGLDDIGIVKTLSRHCEDFSEKSGLSIEFLPVDMDGIRPDHNLTINLYRIVQESLNNVWKHANAKQVIVSLIAAPPDIRLQIEDDGQGFNVHTREYVAAGEKRMGLRIMRERVNLLKGSMTILSDPLTGTCIAVTCPLVETTSETAAEGNASCRKRSPLAEY
jgi:signal transduction histidine kinase